AYGAAMQRAGDDADKQRAEVEALALPSGPQTGPVPAIQVVIDTLTDEEWYVQLHNWRNSEFAAADSWSRYLDGRDWELQLMAGPRRDDPAAQAPRPHAA